MITLRPHSLSYKTTVSGGHYNENGDWHEAIVEFSEKVACRYEPNGKANTIVMPDGASYAYSYVVYLDNSIAKDFRYGEVVRLFDTQGRQIAEKVVAGFHKGQLNARIWL